MALTSFYRDRDTLDRIERIVIPRLNRLPEIRIWDAGCATGEEPYTVALLFAEAMGPFEFPRVFIDATDIEETVGQFQKRVTEGIYGRAETQWVPPAIFEKYFRVTERDGYSQISGDLRRQVTFTRHDLRSLKPPRTDFGLIVCKNVLMHIPYPERIEVVRMFHKALRAKGFLALEGTQEMLPETEHLFTRCGPSGSLYEKTG